MCSCLTNYNGTMAVLDCAPLHVFDSMLASGEKGRLRAFNFVPLFDWNNSEGYHVSTYEVEDSLFHFTLVAESHSILSLYISNLLAYFCMRPLFSHCWGRALVQQSGHIVDWGKPSTIYIDNFIY